MPPDEQSPGFVQEGRVRSYLVSLGYTQPYGTRVRKLIDEIRRSLGINGKCADFVEYHPQIEHWLIAESKGSNLADAEEQPENTMLALLAKESNAVGMIQLQIHINAKQFVRLKRNPAITNGLGGYFLRSADGFLGTYPSDVWEYREIRGSRIVAVRDDEPNNESQRGIERN